MPYVKSMIFLNLAKKASVHTLKVKGRTGTRRALHHNRRLKSHNKKRVMTRRLTGRHHAAGYHLRRGRAAGMRHAHTGAKGTRHAFAHRKVSGHFTRRKHTEKKRARGVHAKRHAAHYTKKRIVHKGYHHRNHPHVVHHAHRHHAGYHGRRRRRG